MAGQSNANLTDAILNNWSKSSEGLVVCCGSANLVLDSLLTNWHRGLNKPPRCSRKGGSQSGSVCPAKCKPKKTTHCSFCVQWVDIICGGNGHNGIAVNASKINWGNARPSEFYDSALAVAKILGLKNISESDLARIRKFSDFDAAWTLQILQNIKFLNYPDILKEVRM